MSDIVYEKKTFSMPFLSGYKELKIPIFDKDGNSAWPELFTSEKIQQMRETVGERHFSAQMMLKYVATDKIRLNPGGLKIYENEFDKRNAKIADNIITGLSIYWDPSSGRKTSDNSVCVLIYKDEKNKKFFIHDVLYLVVPDNIDYPLAYQCNLVLNFVRKYDANVLGVETNGLGNALPEIMRNVISNTGYKIKIRPINNTRKKEDRILDAVEPLLSSGRLYAHTRISQTPLISEMLARSPIGGPEHDDGLDALAGAIMSDAVPVHPLSGQNYRYMANTNFNI